MFLLIIYNQRKILRACKGKSKHSNKYHSVWVTDNYLSFLACLSFSSSSSSDPESLLASSHSL